MAGLTQVVGGAVLAAVRQGRALLLRDADVPVALVHDEYGHFEGIVTPADLLSAIAGDFVSDQDDGEEPAIFEREDGSLLVSGWATADGLSERIGISLEEDRDYATEIGRAHV